MKSEVKKSIKQILDWLLIITGIISLISFIAVIGFYLSEYWFGVFFIISEVTIIIYALQEIARLFLHIEIIEYLKSRLIENLIALIVIFRMIFPDTSLWLLSFVMPELNITEITLFLIALTQIAVVFSIFLRVLRVSNIFSGLNIHSGTIIVISFFVLIIIGTLLLLLPRSVEPDKTISIVDALFTSTSAVCVTGLVVFDTSAQFSGIGKLIIASLIQIGGLGLMTLTTFFAVLFAGGLSVRAKVFVQDLLSNQSINEGLTLLKRIFLFTFLVEFIGSILLYLSLSGSLINIDKELLYKCIFHSISAFCNAGFSVYSENLMYQSIQSNYLYLSVIMFLIVLGGIGFYTMLDISTLFNRKQKYKRLKTSTKLILYTTFGLIIFGAVIMFIFEVNNSQFSGFIERAFHSLFLSVTARTAGFNTISIGLLSPATVMIIIILMWIGASPGSTGGGIKTTTFAVALITLYNYILGKERVEIFNREIETKNIRQSLLVIISSLIFLGIGTTLLVNFEPKIEPLDLIFEAVSAISTVGLSRNITYILGEPAKIILIILMFVGRIGVFTFFLSLYKPKPEPRYKLPIEQVIIG